MIPSAPAILFTSAIPFRQEISCGEYNLGHWCGLGTLHQKVEFAMKHPKFSLALSFLAISLVSTTLGVGQVQPVSASPRELNVSVSTAQLWTDTGLDVVAGDVVQITATPASAGSASNATADTSTCDPQGVSGAVSGGNLPLSLAPAGALIAKLHPQGGLPLLVGLQKEIKIAEQGHLFLGVNNGSQPVCQGSFVVRLQVTNAAISANSAASAAPNIKGKLAAAAQIWLAGQLGSANASAPDTGAENSAVASGNASAPANAANATAAKVSPSTASLAASLQQGIDALPRRVNDKFKNLGDMVNFVIVGSKSDVQAALQAANWFVADTSNTEAVTKAVLMTYEKKDYLQMPMSQLYLFDRVQDFGYEQAEAYAVVASRHHFRLWKAPFQVEGKDVWVGAGTHDIGFEKDQRNGSVTHKIDPAVDGERDHIGESLQKTGRVKSLAYYLPPEPVQDARNATGGGYKSDGRILVISIADEKAASAKP